MTLWLLERMRQWHNQPAVVWNDTVFSYGELLDRVDMWRAELRSRSIEPGAVILIEGGFSPNACALLLAALELGAIIVPLTPLLRVHRAAFEQIAEVQWACTFDNEDQWQIAHSDRTVDNPLTRGLISRGHPGLVIFSSGSTGNHKAVLHDFASLLEKFRKPRQRKTTLTFLLFDHIGGIDTLFSTCASGGTIVTTASRAPEDVCQAIARHHVHTLPTSPTF